jgi:PAS domain S-box-containing protein
MEMKSILIVEDEAVSALDLSKILKNLGYLVAGIVSTGEKAIAAVDAQQPDLILMDIHLAGEMTGIEAAVKILRNHAIPIIYLTAHSEPDIVREATITRPYGYIIKPFTERELQTVIEIALYKAELDREYRKEHARLEDSTRKQTKDLQQAHDALLASEKKYLEFISLLPEIVFECDLTGNLTLVNENSLQFFGYTREDLKRGLNLFDHIVPEDRDRVRQGIGRVAGGGKTAGSQYTGMLRDGTRFPLLVYTTRVIENGRCTGIRGILVDISEQKKAEQSMQQVINKLGILNSITRHDILNKLTSLSAFLDLISEDQPDPEKKAYGAQCTAIVATINRQVEFMRDYQEIGIRLPVWQDPAAIIRHVAEVNYAPDIAIQVPNPGFEIFTDPLFEKVIETFIDNAIRHGEHVKTMTFSVREEGSELHITCEDDGAGIPAGDKEHIFEKGFGRNTGLGLFLAREILDITGITLSETGTYQNGARFEIIVPKESYRKGSLASSRSGT